MQFLTDKRYNVLVNSQNFSFDTVARLLKYKSNFNKLLLTYINNN